MSLDVIVVGAGIGGLTAALALQQQGLRVALCEQANEPFVGGAGLVIGASGAKVLGQLGLGAALDDLAVRPAHIAIRHFQTGRLLAETATGSAAIVAIALTAKRGRGPLSPALTARRPGA